MNSFKEVHGVLPVLQTPFNAQDEIDKNSLQREVEWVLGQGADGVTTGMVTEILRLSPNERMSLHEMVSEVTNTHQALTVLSAGSESLKQSILYAKHAEVCHADAVMVNPPLTTSLGDEDIYTYYGSILDVTEIPMIVQDASGYIGRPLSIELQVKLLDNYGTRVYFKPEAVPIGPRLTVFMEATSGRARVFEGSGGGALIDTFPRGLVGTMPGADLTWALVALWKALKEGDWNQVDLIAGPLANLISLEHSLDAYLAIEKYLLVKQGIFTSVQVREPVGYRMDGQTKANVDRLFAVLQARVFSNA
ncbi:MAG: dihydrodipicolinate synthase family protein [Candidatus Nanopelagicaceae bacterium]|nr:dihydrodipicolinate synthase family protein [Candidatus Nanopelagicaceae bacterium]